MTNSQAPAMTGSDFNALLVKLESFADTLSSGERAALDSLLEQALATASQGAEVSGYDYSSVLPSGDLLAAFGIS